MKHSSTCLQAPTWGLLRAKTIMKNEIVEMLLRAGVVLSSKSHAEGALTMGVIHGVVY